MELIRIGLPGQFVQLVVNIYGSTKAVIRVFEKGVSRIFEQTRGVKQRSTLSPRLTRLLPLNSATKRFQLCCSPTIVLFALVAKTARELQILIDLMAEYLESMKLLLNLGKTEIMIFDKGGRRNLVENEKSWFKGQEIKVVEKAKYLGFTMTPNCSWRELLNEMSKRDLQKAFDSVDRELVTMELIKIGLPGQFAQLVANIYGSTKAVIRVSGKGVSRICVQTRGIKQRSTLSPRLTRLLPLNSATKRFQLCCWPTIVLFALVAKTARELQILIDLMAEYLESMKLLLNHGKTEIMIFDKGGRRNLVENEKSWFKGQEIKVVEKAKNLGFTMTPNCSWKELLNEMSKRGKAAVGALLRNDLVKKSKSLKMFKEIFDLKIKPEIHYRAELWGLEAVDKLESVQFRYYKRLVGLH
ncbi:hypothetical protein QYM36_003203 [Artemia franciscana]|uniref:Reverse transcriptase domain-containing protein n=1 Tax=Artemia franciscana TaxID=6661 RepID=A0AA88I522_ARTSF|nr:hypothetical protein QYM36_003203 [Artemia franciscana]